MVISINNSKLKISYSFILIISLSLILNSNNVLYVLLFSSLHELGHLVCLLLFGIKEFELSLSYCGFAINYKNTLSAYKEIVFLLSGVFVNLLFCLLNVSFEINLLLLLVNILPIYPLDGGRVLKLITENIFGLNLGSKIFLSISVFFIISLIIFAVVYKNFSLLLISVYIIIFSLNSMRYL